MLKITIPEQELYNEKTNEFLITRRVVLTLEHSLVSLAKWESKYHKPFLSRAEKTREETLDYVRMMTITQNVDPEIYKNIPTETFQEILEYIEDDQTATTIKELHSQSSREVVTAEIIYHWMIVFQVPFECQKWHLNRLLMLIRVCNIKQEKPKKLKPRDILNRNKALNASRRAKSGSKG